MKKWILGLTMLIPMFSQAIETAPVFVCLNHTQSFEIKQNPRTKQLTANLITSDRKEMSMNCETKAFGYHCKKGDYVAKVLKGATSGRMMVQVELDGDFGMDSGYLYTIYCRQF